VQYNTQILSIKIENAEGDDVARAFHTFDLAAPARAPNTRPPRRHAVRKLFLPGVAPRASRRRRRARAATASARRDV
jgi:hypothetical protein